MELIRPRRRVATASSHGLLDLATRDACLMALGLLMWEAGRRVRAAHHRRRHTRCAVAPRRLQTWEGEGGRPNPDGSQSAT